MSELKNLEAELADIRRRRDAVQTRIQQATDDSSKAKFKSQRDNAATRISGAQKEQADLDAQITAITGRIAALNDANQGRIQAGREAGETARRTLMDEAPKPWTEFYEGLRQDLPLPPASFLPAAVAGTLFGAAKLPMIPSNWMGRAKASGYVKEAQQAKDLGEKSRAMGNVKALADEHGFLYRPTGKDLPMMGAAFGTGALAGMAPTAYDMMLPDVNQEKKAALAYAAQLDDNDPRKAEALSAAQAMPDGNPARKAAFDRLNDPYFYLKQGVLAGAEGVAGYEAADLLSKGLRFPFKNPKAEVAAFNQSNSVDGAMDVYKSRLASEIASRNPSKRDVSKAISEAQPKTPVQPDGGTPPRPDGSGPQIPPGQPPALPPPAGGASSNRGGPWPMKVSEMDDLQSQLTQMLTNSKLPGAMIGLPVAGAAMMGGGGQAEAAQGGAMNPLVALAIEELRRRGMLAEPAMSAPGLLGDR